MRKDTIKELEEQSSRIAMEMDKMDILRRNITETVKNSTIKDNFKTTMENFNDLLKEEKPEYKFYNNGFEALNNVELISLVINNGSGTKKSLEQARQIMNICDGSLKTIFQKRIEEIEIVQGIGDSKAMALLSAIELGKRYYREETEREELCSAPSIYKFMHPIIGDLQHEEAHVLLFNQNYKLLKHIKLSSGGITETSVDIRMVIKEAVINNATSLILCHNHPSGNKTASSDDDKITIRLKKACDIMRIYFVDHVIITDNGYFSYRESGKL